MLGDASQGRASPLLKGDGRVSDGICHKIPPDYTDSCSLALTQLMGSDADGTVTGMELVGLGSNAALSIHRLVTLDKACSFLSDPSSVLGR